MTQPSRLVDPVHIFNSTGLAMVTEQFLLETIDELLKENAQLKKAVRAAEKAGLIEVVGSLD